MPYLRRHTLCVCVSQSKRENHPVPQEGGWEIGMAIHSQRHDGWVGGCVCWAKRENHPVPQGGGGFSFLPGPHAQLENHKTAGGISCSTGGAGRIHHDVHCLLK